MKAIVLDAAGCHDGQDFLEMFPVGWRRILAGAWAISQVEGDYTTAIRDGDRVRVATFWRTGRWTTLFWL
jgi:hypothetical protein